MPKLVNKAEKQQKILASAVDEIYEHGIDAVSMRRIAHASGMGRSSVYSYYKNCEDILHAALQHVISVFDKMQADFLTQSISVTEKIAYFFKDVFYRDEHLGRYISVVIEYLTSRRYRRLKPYNDLWDFSRHLRILFTSLLEQGIAQGEFIMHDTAQMAHVLSALNEQLILHKSFKDDQADTFDHNAIRLILQGITKTG